MTTPITAISGFASPESEVSYGRARELCEALGAAEQLVTVLHGQWVSHTVALAHRDAGEVAARILRMGERQDIDSARMIGHRATGWNALFRGNLDVVAFHLEQALSIYDQDRVKFRELRLRTHHDHRVATLSCLTIHQWLCGFPERAVETRTEVIAYARELEHVASLAYALLHAGCLPAAFGDDSDSAREFGSELLELANDHGLPTYIAAGTVLTGWATGKSADLRAGIATLQDGLAMIDRGNFRYFLPCYLALLARLYMASGDVVDARRTLADANNLVEQSGERVWEAELYRLTGDVLLMLDSGSPDAAQREYERAVEIARREGAKSLELRASTSLARLWSAQDRADESRDVLKPVFDWFTEGFDTPDLKRARTVLENLS